jgi:two-component system LytT family response regulator
MSKVSTETNGVSAVSGVSDANLESQEVQPIRALIVDDEALARQGLALRLEQDDRVELLRSCKNGREALEAIAELEPDLIFLDIQMPGMSGFEVVERLQQDNMPLVVFVTAFDEYAVKAFEVHAVDYLLKPIEQERLQQALDHVAERMAGKRDLMEKRRLMDVVIRLTGRSEDAVAELMVGDEQPVRYSEKLAIKDGSSTTFVPVRDIDWIDAAGDYMCVHVKGETHIMRTTMKELESALDPNLFQRVHRSTIVNLDRVEKVSSHINGEFHLTLLCGTSLKMSRSYKDKVRHFF